MDSSASCCFFRFSRSASNSLFCSSCSSVTPTNNSLTSTLSVSDFSCTFSSMAAIEASKSFVASSSASANRFFSSSISFSFSLKACSFSSSSRICWIFNSFLTRSLAASSICERISSFSRSHFFSFFWVSSALATAISSWTLARCSSFRSTTFLATALATATSVSSTDDDAGAIIRAPMRCKRSWRWFSGSDEVRRFAAPNRRMDKRSRVMSPAMFATISSFSPLSTAGFAGAGDLGVAGPCFSAKYATVSATAGAGAAELATGVSSSETTVSTSTSIASATVSTSSLSSSSPTSKTSSAASSPASTFLSSSAADTASVSSALSVVSSDTSTTLSLAASSSPPPTSATTSSPSFVAVTVTVSSAISGFSPDTSSTTSSIVASSSPLSSISSSTTTSFVSSFFDSPLAVGTEIGASFFWICNLAPSILRRADSSVPAVPSSVSSVVARTTCVGLALLLAMLLRIPHRTVVQVEKPPTRVKAVAAMAMVHAADGN
mmetsp:Transcript_22877/g.50817  ORF Transcript_22877/g.50817 Transcript_22877/m.50817 type:complete len:493 (-) Transcript_22877:11-1489(-)